MIFFPGSTGVIYRQFSVTVIASMLLSVVVALVLSPGALRVACSSRWRRGTRPPRPASACCRPFFLWFDRAFFRSRDAYTQGVEAHPGQEGCASSSSSSLIVAAMGFLYLRMPTGYLPDEDQGILMTMVQLPVGSTLEQTEAVMNEVRAATSSARRRTPWSRA